MARLIGLSGPQGGGKTTLLNGLKEKALFRSDISMVVDDFKVSREVQKQLGWDSLEQVMESPDTMMKFQAKVRDVKYVRELENVERTDVDIILTERTFADIVTYTQLWTWELVDAGKWELPEAVEFLVDYVRLCAGNQKVYSGNLILPSMPHVLYQDDPHRAKQKHIDFVTTQLDRFFAEVHPRNIPILKITQESVEGRIEEAYTWISKL